jgi:hypothetical protein
MELAAKVAEAAHKYRATAIFVDETGLGAGVVDRLKQLNFPVTGVNFSGSSLPGANGEKYANKRAEMWGTLREALPTLALQNYQIDKDRSILEDLTVVNYTFNNEDAILLEKKADIKRREGWSPDVGDALALTYAYPHMGIIPARQLPHNTFQSSVHYNPYAQVH